MNSGKKREGRQLIFAKHRLFLIGLYTFLCIISMVILPFPSVYRWRNQGSEKVKVMFMVTQVPSGRMGIWSGSVDSKGHALPTVTGCLLATWEQWKSNEQKGSVDPALPSPFSCCCEFTERSPWAPASWAVPKGAINEPATAASEISVFFYGPVIPLSPLIMQQSETRSNETGPRARLSSLMCEFQQDSLCADILCVVWAYWPLAEQFENLALTWGTDVRLTSKSYFSTSLACSHGVVSEHSAMVEGQPSTPDSGCDS